MHLWLLTFNISNTNHGQFVYIGAEKLSKYQGHGYPIIRHWLNMNVNTRYDFLHEYKLNCFCYSVLKAATQKFSCKNLLGQGGFGDVYMGYINHCPMTAARPGGGYAVAVKRLRKKGTQGDNEWLVFFYDSLSPQNLTL